VTRNVTCLAEGKDAETWTLLKKRQRQEKALVEGKVAKTKKL
jgi:hypothetical protein